MKVIIIGSVAAGTSAAAKIRRNNEDIEIVIYEKDSDISYSSCGLPYYIGKEYISRDNLTPRDAEWFKKRFNIDIKTMHEVLSIDRADKKLKIHDHSTNHEFKDHYDKLIIATGASSSKPPIKGIDSENAFFLKNVNDADKINNFIENKSPGNAVIIGSGFIGLEVAENLLDRNIDVTIIEAKNSIMPHLDEDMSIYIEKYFKKSKIPFYTDTIISEIKNNRVISSDKTEFKADLVIVATGIKPEVTLAKDCGIKTGEYGAIIVDDKMRTSDPDIYACGDCCEHKNRILDTNFYRPLGSTANKMGRIAGDAINGGNLSFKGVLGTGIFKIDRLSVGFTGLTEREALSRGIATETVHCIKENQSKYIEESRELVIKTIADSKTHKLIGVQIIGERGVDKRLDVFVTAITSGMKVEDLFNLDLAYSPMFSTTKDPVMYIGMIYDNIFNRKRRLIDAKKLLNNHDKYTIIDVRSKKDYDKGHIPTAISMPLFELREKYDTLDKDANIIVHCNKGVTGNAAQNFLINMNFTKVFNLSGGYKHYAALKEKFKQ